jgi:hypothetical protein
VRFLLAATLLLGCATTDYIQGTKIPDTEENRAIVKTVERYRQAMERRDVVTLIALAHPWYTQRGGTGGQDDYGYEGLKKVIQKRLGATKAVRYGIAYKKLTRNGSRAYVDVYIDASYQLAAETGDRWDRHQDDNRFELIWDGKTWRFLSGY